MAAYTVNDAMVKEIARNHPVGEVIFIRGLFTTLLIGSVVFALGYGSQLKRVWTRPVLLRSICDGISTACFVIALVHMKLADLAAVLQVSPLILAAFSVLFFGETVGWRRWTAIMVGFAGVLMVVQPAAAGFNWFALVALFATSLHASRDLITRRIDRAIPTLLVTLSNAVIITLTAGAFEVAQGWQPVPLDQLLYLLLASALLSGGYWLVIECMRHGELSVVAPFRYIAIVWALLLGYLVWGDIPNLLAMAGIVLLVGSGLYILHRERLRARKFAAEPIAAEGLTEPAAR